MLGALLLLPCIVSIFSIPLKCQIGTYICNLAPPKPNEVLETKAFPCTRYEECFSYDVMGNSIDGTYPTGYYIVLIPAYQCAAVVAVTSTQRSLQPCGNRLDNPRGGWRWRCIGTTKRVTCESSSIYA